MTVLTPHFVLFLYRSLTIREWPRWLSKISICSVSLYCKCSASELVYPGLCQIFFHDFPFDLLIHAFRVVLVELIISIIWVAHDTPTVRSFSITEFEHMLICESASTNFQKALTTTSMAFNGLLLLLTTILCWKTRDVNALYNETKWIGISVYNIVACCAVFLPLIYNSVSDSSFCGTVLVHHIHRVIAVGMRRTSSNSHSSCAA